MIEIDVQRKAFGESQILSNIQLTIDEGEVLAILGPSGIGKTTLLRIVAGLDSQFEGSITRPEKIAMVFQEPNLLPWRSALDNVILMTGASKRDAKAMLDKVGLTDKHDHFPSQLSLGQQRRLSLARAFATNPNWLILDEPFASLDQDRLDEMLDLTMQLIAGANVTTFFVTHSEKEAKMLADKVVRLSGHPATIG